MGDPLPSNLSGCTSSPCPNSILPVYYPRNHQNQEEKYGVVGPGDDEELLFFVIYVGMSATCARGNKVSVKHM